MPTPADLLPLILFAFVLTFTPGPNTLMISAFSSVFGVRPTLPCAAGITVGISSVVFVVALGLGAFIAAHPNFSLALRVGGLVYIGWLVWKILRSSELGTAEAKPIGFTGAFLLQWINPKAWAAALGAVSAFCAIAAGTYGALIIAGVFFILLIPATLVWSAFGAGIRTLLGSGRTFRAFNWLMAVLVVASMLPVLLGFQIIS